MLLGLLSDVVYNEHVNDRVSFFLPHIFMSFVTVLKVIFNTNVNIINMDLNCTNNLNRIILYWWED